MSKGSRTIETQITVYGATSFAAKHVLTYLMQSSLALQPPPAWASGSGGEGEAKQAPQDDEKILRITLAGRNALKLEQLQIEFTQKMQNLSQVYADKSGGCTVVWDVVVADGSHASKLRAMADRTAVVLNCAGPFAQYSSHVVEACAAAGTDYVDITGEVSWVGDMRLRHGAAAEQSGARIISCCGYDSVPSDMAVWCAVQELRRLTNNPQAVVDTATTWHAMFGFANGGTVRTLQETGVDWQRCWQRGNQNNGNKDQWVPYLLDDPLILTHPRVRVDPAHQDLKNRLAWQEWKNQLFPFFHSIFRMGASAPFMMAPANAKVVHASAMALNYAGPNFVYNERYLPAGFKLTTHLGTLAIVPALMTQVAVCVALLILKLPILGKWIANWLVPPGSGASDAVCRVGHVEVYCQVSAPAADGGTTEGAAEDRANCFLQFEGDPGNYVTSQCVAEAALTLLYDRQELPARSVDGFGTPAELLGAAYWKRLQNSAVRPVTVQTHVRPAVQGLEWKMFP